MCFHWVYTGINIYSSIIICFVDERSWNLLKELKSQRLAFLTADITILIISQFLEYIHILIKVYFLFIANVNLERTKKFFLHLSGNYKIEFSIICFVYIFLSLFLSYWIYALFFLYKQPTLVTSITWFMPRFS